MIKHTIRSKNGGTTEISLSPMIAIVKNCIECMGFESNPETCTSKLCPLYPFRGGESHSGKVMSEENKEKSRIRMIEMHNAGKI